MAERKRTGKLAAFFLRKFQEDWMANSELGNQKIVEMKKRLEQDIAELFDSGELALEEIRNTALGAIAQLVQRIQELPSEREREEAVLPDAERSGKTEPLEELSKLTLLVSNKERTEYDLFSISGMEKSEVMNTLSGMERADRTEVETALESAGAVVNWQGDEKSREFRDFHLNVTYDRDTKEVTDVQKKMSEQRRKGREQPESRMEQIDLIMDNQELSPMKQTEQIIGLLEQEKTIFMPEDRKLLVNHAYKLQDMEHTLNLMLRLSNEREREDSEAEKTVDWIKAEIDFFPDQAVGMAEMYAYGYRWEEMLPLTKETALELYDKELPILRLYPDNNSNTVEDRTVILEHEGMFGIERSDWEDYLAEQSRNQELEGDFVNQEEQLLKGSEDRYGIYQLKDGEETRDFRYMGMDYLEEQGIEVERNHYNLIYSAPLEAGMTLDDIWEKFNIDHPEDFQGHSLSISDVVVLHQNGENTSHYIDRIGFQELPEFIKEVDEAIVEQEKSAMEREEQEETETEPQELSVEAEKAELSGKTERTEPVSYYVIEDISTWKNHSANRSDLERFDNLSDAMDRFMEYQGKDRDYSDGDAKTTLGVKIGLSEFDLLYIRENEHFLVQDFLQITAAQESNQFKKDLQTIHNTIGFDKISLTRDMTPEEVKAFVRERFANQLKQGGLEDISLYMERFDSLYEQGRMEGLMPTANQKRIRDVLPISDWENPYLTGNGVEEIAVAIADRYFSIQTCEEGYDYSIYDKDYKLLDGGIYDNPDISIHQALHEIITDLKEPAFNQQLETYYRTPLQGEVQAGDDMKPIDYDGLMEKSEQTEHITVQTLETEKNQAVEEFKRKTEELFHSIGVQTPEDIEQTVIAYAQSKIDEYEIDVHIVDVAVSGSHSRGLEQEGSDLDVVVEYTGVEREDDMFNILNEDGLQIGGVKVDINPITEEQTGTLETYLPGVETYLVEKSKIMQEKPIKGQIQPQEILTESLTEVTLTVAECGEFPNLGEYHDGIKSVEEAIAIFKQIPPERMNGIPSIGIQVHQEGTESYEDTQLDIFSGQTIDLEMLSYVPEISGNAKALEIVEELIERFPDASIIGELPELSDRNRREAARIAAEIDTFAYEYDVYQYRDSVEDRQAQVEELTSDIQTGESSYLRDFLQEVIEEGADPEDVEKAKELLERLAEYKPLAKVEELEEANYNMIDNVLNNEKPKKEEHTEGRVSIKEKLAEKRAELSRSGKQAIKEKESKEPEKKPEREI